MVSNLAYKVRRFFGIERGIVEKVESLSDEELKKTFLGQPIYPKDDLGNLPQRVFFRTPLNEVLSDIPSITTSVISGSKSMCNCEQIYPRYKPGDNYQPS